MTQLLRVDGKNRVLYFAAVGKEAGRDPYYRHLYRVGFDGHDQQLLTPANADHTVTLSPSADWFVDVLLDAGYAAGRRTADQCRRAGAAARESGHLEADGGGLETAAADHGQGA